MKQPETDGTPLGNLRVWIWQLEHWFEIGDGLSPISVVIANLEIEIENCKRAGIDVEKETSMTFVQIKQLGDKVGAERRKKIERLGLV